MTASLHPSTERAWLLQAQLRLYRNSTRNNTILAVVAGLIVALAFSPWVSAERRFGWWAALAIVGTGFEIMARALDRVEMNALQKIRRRAWLHLADSSLLLIAWCSMSVVLWAPDSAIDHTLLITILACSLAGAISSISIHPAVGASAFAIHAIFMLAPTLLSPMHSDHLLAALTAVFVVMMAGQALVSHEHMTKLLFLEHERSQMVSDLQRAQRESDREREHAADASKAKSQFLSHMNHELRTPMNAILGFSELIANKSFGADVEKYAEYAGIIHESGRYLLSLINDMIDLAKIDGGKLYLRESEFDLSRLLAEEYDENLAKAADASLAFEKRIDPALPPVRADQRAVRQIVLNLISNAIKYTPPGGRVSLFAARTDDGRIAFGVEDSGIGIAPEDQRQVFERFGRGRHDVTTADRGTGLGLAIVKGFADAHDGAVVLDSALGEGTRVTVYLPKDRAMTPYPMTAAAG